MDLARIVFVLHRPRSPDNVGAAARALANMGLARLVLVDPLGYDPEAARKMAAGPEADAVLDRVFVHRTLDEALEKCVAVVATTARPMEGRAALDPREAANALLDASADGDAALLFGDEKSGLPNRVLDRVAHVCTIPTAGKRALNLAQAALLLAWEIRRAADARLRAGADARTPNAPAPPRADAGALARLRARTRETLLAAGFLNPQNPDAVLDEMLRGLDRSAPTEREIELWLAALDQLRRSLVR